MTDDIGRVIAKLDHLAESLSRVEGKVDRINGEVRGQGEEIAILKATSLRIDTIKMSALVGVVALVIGIALKVTGIL